MIGAAKAAQAARVVRRLALPPVPRVPPGIARELAKRDASAGGTASADDGAGIYCARRLLNVEQLDAWWAEARLAGEPATIDADPHLTVAYSRAAVTFDPDPSEVLVPPDALRWATLGKDLAVVLAIRSPLLEDRWDALRRCGCTWDFVGYTPHVTLFYLSAGYDSAQWRDGSYPALPGFALHLGPELVGPRNENLFT